MGTAQLLLFIYMALSLDILEAEPSIQCTVVKVRKTVTLDRVGSFSKLYQTIYNDPVASRLFVGEIELININPKVLSKTAHSEKISIQYDKTELTLEIEGKPISRKGLLKMNGAVLAEITCH
jgi:hypothetical protein